MSYNSDYINCINHKFKDIPLEDTSQEKKLIHQEHAYFSVMLSEYGKPQNFQEEWYHKDTEAY